jgi:hypothetical protein
MAFASTLAAHPAVGIVMAADGSVFYSDNVHVWLIMPGGNKSIAVPGVHTHELWLDARGNLYGEHLWYEGGRTGRWGHRVWKRSPDGAVSGLIPARSGFRDDYKDFFFVRDQAERMYWLERDSRAVIVKRRGSGPPETLATLPPGRAGWMAATPDGEAIVCHRGRLLRIRAGGHVHVLAERLTHSALEAEVMGLWTDASGNVYAAAPNTREVKRITPKGDVSTAAVIPAPWRPAGGLAAPDGSLWILEFSPDNAQRLRRVDRSGAHRVY